MKTVIIGEKKEAMVGMASCLDDNVFKRNNKTTLENEANRKCFLEGEKYILVFGAGHLFRSKKPDEFKKEWKPFNLLKNPQDYMLKELCSYMCNTPDENPNKKRCLNTICKVLKRDDYDLIIHAGDADAEGEAIVRDILNYALPKDKQHIKKLRFWSRGSFSSKEGVTKAMNELKDYDAQEYINLWFSQKSRSEGDYLVGVKNTKALTDFGGGGKLLSAGRVQSVVLELAIQREREIQDFETNGPKKFYSINAKLGELTLSHFYYALDEENKQIKRREYFTSSEAQAVIESMRIVNNSGKVESLVTQKSSTKSRPLPLSGSDFAEEMMKEYKITYKKCNELLSYLRAEGFTTYEGTNGVYFELCDSAEVETALQSAKAYFNVEAEFSIEAPLFDDKKAQKQNHPPLHLTSKVPTSKDIENWKEATTKKGGKLPFVKEAYELIAKRILVSFLEDDLFESTSIVVNVAGHMFDASFKKPIKQGWRVFMQEEISDSSCYLPLKDGDICSLIGIEIKEGKTKKPRKHTEGSILSAMLNIQKYFDALISEEVEPQKKAYLKKLKKTIDGANGIGTDRTRENFIAILTKRGYWKVSSSTVIEVLPLGYEVNAATPTSLKSVTTTAMWEMKFEEIRRGEYSYENFIKAVDNSTMHKMIPSIFNYYRKKGFNKPVKQIKKETELVCPLCRSKIIEATKVFRCEKNKFKDNKQSGCKFSIIKVQKLLQATLSVPQIELLLKGETLEAPNGNKISLDLTNDFFTKIDYSENYSTPQNSNELIETEKTFRLGGNFCFKNFFGKALTKEQAQKLFNGDEITLTRKKKESDETFKVIAWLGNDSKGNLEWEFK